jgi:hypothetical protein
VCIAWLGAASGRDFHFPICTFLDFDALKVGDFGRPLRGASCPVSHRPGVFFHAGWDFAHPQNGPLLRMRGWRIRASVP